VHHELYMQGIEDIDERSSSLRRLVMTRAHCLATSDGGNARAEWIGAIGLKRMYGSAWSLTHVTDANFCGGLRQSSEQSPRYATTKTTATLSAGR
jgi:hypothetical protein